MRIHLLTICCVMTLVAAAGLATAQRRGTSKGPAKQPTGKESPTPSPAPDTQQTNSAASAQPPTNGNKAESAIEITMHTSRAQVTAGSGFGIAADIHNKSSQSVYLRPRYLIMSLPAEIDPDPPSLWWALIPPQQETTNWEEIIHVAPGATTTVFWAGNPQNEKAHWWTTALNLLSFPPGEYTIRVVGNYWSDLASAQNQSKNYFTQTAESKVAIAAPQWVILLGAVIGGLVAYFLLPNARLHPQRIDMFGLFTAVLLSSIVTILLARLSETQFLVRVTIADLWGAIAIGFVAGASGTAILQKYTPHSEAGSGRTEADSGRNIKRLKGWLRGKGKKKEQAGENEPKEGQGGDD